MCMLLTSLVFMYGTIVHVYPLMCLFTSDLPVEEARRVLQTYCYQASSYVLSTDNNGSCDSLHCSVIANKKCTVVKRSLQEERF